jgi:two-component system nitrogen regulation sensor histidine kinase NtrY
MPFLRASYRLGIVLRIILILTAGFAAIVLALMTPYWMVSFWLGVLVLGLCVELIRYHERSLRALREFLQFIRQGDFASVSTIDEHNRELQEAYEYILHQFRNLRIERETNYHYLKRVIEHVDTALVCLKDEQHIQLINQAAMQLLQVPVIKEVSALEKVDQELANLIRSIPSGEKELIRFIRHGRIMKLSIRATSFTLDGQPYKIVSLQDIKPELEEQELESWHKLVRVLTHEIMNSAIPITNMVSVAKKILLGEEDTPREIKGLSREERDDLLESLSTAESRSQGLSVFVQSTRSLTRIPEPRFVKLSIEELFKRLDKLFNPEMEQASIRLNIHISPSDLVLKADRDLIEQVMINLLKNAMDALKETSEPVIDLEAFRTREGGMVLRVCDNGQGISKENLDQIFVPFFSTKKEGSGIGLSLSMQIMKLHKGCIDVRSEEGEGTCVSLEF